MTALILAALLALGGPTYAPADVDLHPTLSVASAIGIVEVGL